MQFAKSSFILLVCYFTLGQALDCYTCFPDAKKNCSDPSDGEIKTCMSGEELCLKIVLDKKVTRSCYIDSQKRKKEGCREKAGVGECYCSGDLCNGSQALLGGTLLVTSSLVALRWMSL
eukprot:TRINITY_DN3699_c0_g1_i1.p1 TRINITY_DN3699_c0_g1~~TRINITY_DN3699_c0_g1_i1.p1  ORF type:complete len:119 (-),score=20.91 TRINITY_DN3699_c0_g1_i1:101-457(-)